MKKVILLLIFSIAFVGCKSKSVTNTKLDIKSEVAIKGNWSITSVTYPGSDVIKVTSFDLADSKCFIGSTWKFVSNNNKGNFSLNSASCTAYSTPITWYINKEGNFVMKILDEAKAKTVKAGYILKVANQTDTSFQLIDRIDVAGKMTDVVYQFVKLN
ncbi:lipocalin family protein [Flavobacterium capsici]|uniref:Lipocalin family protein n=1 Tax=Flavobacterium capsici TaxID=3075618 RepID=A0AA96EXQ9_9FLAO|nr:MULTISPECIES: lipocalin family protein [unclassified Flavobacterium]WNM18977.1 lipocalin family protein [Flavobacterium sp. PMR2A8]WNM23027.1 lipocalin family protein [Flavobacterium sp. PMTSA4]